LECLKYIPSTFSFTQQFIHKIIPFRYAHENGCKWTVQTYLEARHQNNLECLKYLQEQDVIQTQLDGLGMNMVFGYAPNK
jgi:hypothetical protein